MPTVKRTAPAKKSFARRPTAKRAPAKKAAAKKAAGAGGGTFFDHLRKPPTQLSKPPKKQGTTKAQVTPASPKRPPPTYEPGTVFVAMSFRGDGMDDSFAAIRSACKALKLVARRVDEVNSSGVIILEIVDLIERAEFIVVDLTHERPNVYYELGYAHGVGNLPSNILLVAKDGTDLHFDIAALRVRYYKSVAELKKLAKASLGGMIKAAKG